MFRYFRDKETSDFVKCEIVKAFPIIGKVIDSSAVKLEIHDVARPIPGYELKANERAALLRYSQEKIPRFRKFGESGRFLIGEMTNPTSHIILHIFAWVEDWILVGVWLTALNEQVFPKSFKEFVKAGHGDQWAKILPSGESRQLPPLPEAIQAANEALNTAIKNGVADTFRGYRLSVPSAESLLEFGGATMYVIGEDDEGNCLVIVPESGVIQTLRHGAKSIQILPLTLDELIREGSTLTS